jgi:hypothetical protein
VVALEGVPSGVAGLGVASETVVQHGGGVGGVGAHPAQAARRRRPRRVLDQRGGSSHARLSVEHQERALTATDILEQPVERLRLAGAAHQDRGASARGHGTIEA